MDELSKKMHEELSISKHNEILLKAGDVWESVGFDADQETISQKARIYGITLSDCMKFREYWKHYIG